jgi:hypothetical protein
VIEAVRKISCHHICVLIHDTLELGIEVIFQGKCRGA